MSAEENAELIISNWNKTVRKRDTVFILGDVVMEKAAAIRTYFGRLYGQIYVVPGNHDKIGVCKELALMGATIIGNIKYKGFLLSHVPLIESELMRVRGNIHGHIHMPMISSDTPYSDMAAKILNPAKYFNVNCEFHNYTPVLFDEISAECQRRNEIYTKGI